MARPWIDLALGFGLVLGVACASKSGTATEGPHEPVLAKRLAISWGIHQNADSAEVYLATTDETGKQVSYPAGTYQGTCAVITPTAGINALTGVSCKTGDAGTELDAVVRARDEIIVLRIPIAPGAAPDPMAGEEITRVAVPLGVKIDVAN